MAKKVGQILYNGDGYLTQKSLVFSTTTTVVGNTNFRDLVIRFANGENFIQGVSYYLRLDVNRINVNTNYGNVTPGSNDPHVQNIECKLYSADGASYQTLGELLVIEPYQNINDSITDNEAEFLNWCANQNINEMSEGATVYYQNLINQHQSGISSASAIRTTKQVIELIFTPYITSTQIVLELRRVGYDYNNSGTARIVSVDQNNYDAAIINNILPYSCDKIGIQTTPGSLVIINGEGMRVGKSGVIEINSGIAINSVGFAAPNNEINNFILDYIYTE